MLKPGLYLVYERHVGNKVVREEDHIFLMHNGKLDWAGMAAEALRRNTEGELGPPEEIQGVDLQGRVIDLTVPHLLDLAKHVEVRRKLKSNPRNSDGTDPESNRLEIEQMLKSAPSDWRSQFASGMRARAASGQAHGGTTLNLDNALLILGITAGGNASGDRASGSNAVPSAVRAAAMKGLRLSHENDYGAWDFIGIARGIQLATQPGVPAETISRMANYFGRHIKDQGSSNFGNDSSPSRGYMAWLNWGGDPGFEWASSTKKRAKAAANPMPLTWGKKAVVLDLGGMGHQPLHGGEHWDERVKQRVKDAPLPVRLQLYDIYRKVRGHKNREFMTSERVNIQWDGAPGKRGNYLVVQYNQGEPFMVTVLINMTLDSAASGRSRTVQADKFFSEPLTFKVDHTDVEKRTVATQSAPGTALRPESRKQRENREMAERLLGRTK